MQPRILDGAKLAQKIQDSISAEISTLSSQVGRRPGLGVVLVGDNEASKAYVASKEKKAARAGIRTFDFKLAAQSTQTEVREKIEQFNNDSQVDGILLQLPLPGHLDAGKLLEIISPSKDADGLHPLNQGLLMKGEAAARPCTPLGCMMLIDSAYSAPDSPISDIKPQDLSGKRAIIIGRSLLVGKPLALMLLEKNATVTMAHSRSPDLPALAAEADIVVAAVGKAALVRKEWIKNGAIVIDVGINRTADGKLVGDVKFDECCERASAITPVPGGVGPMTIAMLLKNTLESYKIRNGINA